MNAFLALVVLSCLSFDVLAGGEDFEFKGSKLGQALSIYSNSKKYYCTDSSFGHLCLLESEREKTIGGAPAKSVGLLFMDEKLSVINVSFEEEYFEQVVRALEKKYGRGTSTASKVRNSFGVTFTNVTTVWVKGTSLLVASRYGADLVTSQVSITRADIASGAKKIQDERAKKNAADL